MAGRSYNSVGAGETPKLGSCKSVLNECRPGGGQSAKSVKIDVSIPKVARPGGQQIVSRKAGDVPAAARPGGAQGVHKSA